MKPKNPSATQITVVIITRDRSHDLIHCLSSLFTQSQLPHEILIIDNGSNTESRHLINKLKNVSNVPLRIVKEPKIGYTFARNRGIKEAKTRWIAFIDDDCIADHMWLENIAGFLSKNGDEIQAVVGQTETYYKNNVYAAAINLIQNFWKSNRISKNCVYDLEILDTKNLVVNKEFLIQKKVFFDPHLAHYRNGSSEDCDLGMQIEKEGGGAGFCQSAIAYHKDPTSFSDYWTKLVNSSVAHKGYEDKWYAYRKVNHSQTYYLNFKEYYRQYVESKKLSWSFASKLLFLVFCSFFIIKTVKLFTTTFR